MEMLFTARITYLALKKPQQTADIAQTLNSTHSSLSTFNCYFKFVKLTNLIHLSRRALTRMGKRRLKANSVYDWSGSR